jgi:DNA-directed RNA polymerase specialized sigma24 family protein
MPSSSQLEEAVRAVLVQERYVLDVGETARAALASLARGEPSPPGATERERLLSLAQRTIRARLFPDPAEAGDGPGLAGYDAATVRATHAAFNRRTREDRELLWASEIEGRPAREIAQALARSENEVRAAIRGARRRFVDDFRRTMRRCASRRGEDQDVA